MSPKKQKRPHAVDVDVESPPPETLACIDCSEAKKKEGFYRNQWKLRDQGGARCKTCWDNYLVSDSSKKARRPMEDDCNTNTTNKKEQLGDMVERTCSSCLKMFVTEKIE